jgi:hypothetical protein
VLANVRKKNVERLFIVVLSFLVLTEDWIQTMGNRIEEEKEDMERHRKQGDEK